MGKAVIKEKRCGVYNQRDVEDPYNGSCSFVREFRLSQFKEGQLATFTRYPHLIPLIAMRPDGMNYCTGLDHVFQDGKLPLIDHENFFLESELPGTDNTTDTVP